MWHVWKPTSDEPLLFSDVNFVKHDPFTVSKKELGSTVKYHNPVPELDSAVRKEQVEKLIRVHDNAGIRIPVLETIRSNGCMPVVPRTQSSLDLQDNLYKVRVKGVT